MLKHKNILIILSALKWADGQPVLYKYARAGNLAHFYGTDKTTKHKYLLFSE